MIKHNMKKSFNFSLFWFKSLISIFITHCTIIKWFPPPQNHTTLKCHISVHIGPRKLNFILCRFQNDMSFSGNFCGPVQYVLPGEQK